MGTSGAAASAKRAREAYLDFNYLNAAANEGQLPGANSNAKICAPTFAATIIDEMRPQTVGRVLGVGLRVAGRLAGQRLAGTVGNPGNPTSRPVTIAGMISPETQRNAGRQTGKATANVARGVGGFLRPFRRVGGIVFLEVAGVFFLLFVLVFGQMVWRMRSNYAQGPDHPKFLMAVGLMLVFLYLSASSFWRARRK
jgi:hypothetical protein